MSPGRRPPATVGEELGSGSAGARLPIVPPRNATSRRPPAGIVCEVALEVADDGVDADAGILVGDGCGRVAQRRLADVERRRTAAACRRRASASSSSRVFSEVPDPSSTSVSAPVTRGDVAGARVEDRPLGAGRVVLRRAG